MALTFFRTSARLSTLLLLAASANLCAQSTTFSYRGYTQDVGPLLNNVANLPLTVEGLGAITDLDVRFDALPECGATAGDNAAAIEHTRIGELVITLISPNNTELVLVDNRGGLRSNFCQTLLDDDGGFPTLGTLTSVSGQFASGNFRPDNALSIFDGEPPNGVWTLRVRDETAGASNIGTANRFSLVFQTAPVPEIVVDRLDDPVPDGCTPRSCSLREAISMANARPGLDRIRLPTGTLELTLPGADERLNATGDLNVLEGLEIVGAGVASTILRQTVSDRLIYVENGRELTLRQLRIEGGIGALYGGAVYASGRLLIEDAAFVGNRATRQGGAIYHRGGGLNDPTRPHITIRRALFDGNETTVSDANLPSVGGALFANMAANGSSYTLQVADSSFTRNRAAQGGGAIAFTNEGGLQPFTRFTVTDSEFIDNRVMGVGHGGAISVNVGGGGSTDTNIERSLFLRNSVSTVDGQNTGGALWVKDGSVGTTLTVVRDSTLCDNVAQAAGGAIFLQDEAGVVGSTLCDNSVRTTDATRMGGGAVALDYGGLEVSQSTFEGNRALRGGAITVEEGDFFLRNATLVPSAAPPAGAAGTILRLNHPTLAGVNLIVYNNILLGSCSFLNSDTVFDTARNNIEDANTCRLLLAGGSTDNQVNVLPSAIALQPLGDNGGPTDTRLPGRGSIAIDEGTNSLCPFVDQRGYARSDGTCDVGAVEVSGTPITPEVFADGFEGPP
jgi:predicted outer membrane repeat protein